jgi:hypothetical protein
MGSVEKNFWSLISLARPPLRERKERNKGKCPSFPHGSSSPAASSPHDKDTPNLSDPRPSLGDLRTHTHHLGAHGGKRRGAQLKEEDRNQPSSTCHLRGGTLLIATIDCPSLRP